mmetsp:Transcript_21234/g.37966  ORF Transcript_21234/g.37966 Transcript_21234/m.37966 type:complete len:166 (+) Transcript_21234:115-612(+)|eukprot:CAMPEP_0175084890 /NCGR_PEP_ID=MMETSP0052_2-20121109/28330_1 /TAXON_ID=51329 ORGANISM="Polytomella parva, Strain SAG 63-3" /NCGR_SAMPLE_ID=MMETSP0052_2 /ASSEMBLY_ACC=CAM_ASM_000194 /LENGTH=165 /DNA_ID=CAMNT_0016356783 /DNA_START=309 /DNA_END=806 /DNA_ORIENTATION=-
MAINPFTHIALTIGKVFVVAIFLSSAFTRVARFDKTTGGSSGKALQSRLEQIEWIDIENEWIPNLVLAQAGIEFFGSALMLANIKFGASVLLSYVVPLTLLMHNFWDEVPGTAAEESQKDHFFKSMSVAGGLILFLLAKLPDPVHDEGIFSAAGATSTSGRKKVN